MAERTEVEIDGVQVLIKKFDPFLSVAIMGELQKYVLGPAGAMFSMQGGKAGIDLSEYAIERTIEKLSAGLDGEILLKLVKKLVNPDYVALKFGELEKPVKATEGNINLAFTEDPVGSLCQVVAEILKVNYTAFFMRAQSLFGSGKTQNQTQES